MIIIDDDDFGQATVQVKKSVPGVMMGLNAEVIGAIEIYSRQGQSVNQIAKNLYLLFQYNSRWQPLQSQVEMSLRYIPEYLPYHDTVQMLLLFS